MTEQKIDEKLLNKDLNQPKGVNRDTFSECLIRIFNAEYDLPFKFIKREHECDRDKLS